MSRSVALWIGKTDDSRPPPRVRLRVFLREGATCFLSKRKIAPGEKWEIDHRVALINGGRNSEENLVPVLVKPHKEKTKADVAEKAKVAAIAERHHGITQPKGTIAARPKSERKTRDQLPMPQRKVDIYRRPI